MRPGPDADHLLPHLDDPDDGAGLHGAPGHLVSLSRLSLVSLHAW